MRKGVFILLGTICVVFGSSAQERFICDGICYEITSIVERQVAVSSLQNGVGYVGDVIIPSAVTYNAEEYSVTSIGFQAFFYSGGLTSIVIPESVTYIGESAFDMCSGLTSLIIPEKVLRIGNSAFAYCIGLTSIVVPENVISIGDAVFEGCTGLESITIPESVISIGNGAFGGCSNLTSIILPEGITSIGFYTFCDCSNLLSVNIPERVTSIGAGAFSGCSSLASITIPAGVTSIGNRAFMDCSNLLSVNIPEGVTSIDNETFYCCSSLTSITLPAGITSIGNRAFNECSNLLSVNIPERVTSIGIETFYCCSSLTSITLPAGVASIGNRAFMRCSNINSIIIPEGVTSIGYETFYGCSNLAEINIYATSLYGYGDDAFYGNASGRKIYVLNDCLETYRSNWSEYSEDILPIEQTANDAGGGLGNWCSYYNGYTDVSVPDGTTIYKAALNGESVTLTEIPGNVIKKGEAVVLKSTSSSVTFSTGTWAGSASAYEGNELQGVDSSAPQADGMIYYVLSKVGDVFGFYKLRDDVDLGAGKAYLAVAALSPVQPRNFLSLGGPDEGTTSVPTIITNEDVWYNLYGVKLQGTPSESGLYIHNGKTVMIK